MAMLGFSAPSLFGLTCHDWWRNAATRNENDHVVRMAVIQHRTSPLIQHVGIEMITLQKRCALLKVGALAPDLGKHRLRLLDLALKMGKRYQTAIALDRVIREIANDRGADCGADRLTQGAAECVFHMINCSHDAMESRRIPSRQMKTIDRTTGAEKGCGIIRGSRSYWRIGRRYPTALRS